MKNEDIIDYAMPCMMAERLLKKVHQCALESNFLGAIDATAQAISECTHLLNALQEMRRREDALRK